MVVDTLILGATFYGCGLARSIPGAMVIESTIAPGGDEVFSFNSGVKWHQKLKHNEAEIFRSMLQQRHALSEDGRIFSAALSPVLAQWCIERNIFPWFATEIIELAPHTVKLLDCSSNLTTIQAKQIIDARSGKSGSPHFTAALRSDKEIQVGQYGDFFITPTTVPELYYLSWDCGTDNWITARKNFYKLWNNRPHSLQTVKIEVAGSRFSYLEYNNSVQALDAGLMQFDLQKHIVSEPENKTTIQDEYDIIIAGAGTAGSVAAVAAGKKNKKVLVIERNTYCGGTFTGGFVSKCYMQNPSGIGGEFAESASSLSIKSSISDTEAMKAVMENNILDSGCTISYQSAIYKVEKYENKITGICWRDGNGLLRHTHANIIIDSTGDGFICRMAGCKMEHGRESDGQFNCYTCSMGRRYPSGFGVANFDSGRINQYDEENFSRVIMQALTDHLKDDYRNEPLQIILSDLPGIREGEHIVPEKTYTLAEFFQTIGKYETPLFHAVSNLDSHVNDLPLESELLNDWITVASLWGEKLIIPIPLRTLFPAGMNGIIAAGRHIGVDHDIGFALRMIPAMLAIGEAAGTIAALSIQDKIPLNKITFTDLEVALAAKNKPRQNCWWFKMTDEEISKGLASTLPGYSIWAAFMQGKKELLKNNLIHAIPDSHLERHCAMALALFDDNQGLPILLDMVKKRDPFIPGNLPHSHRRGYAAVYLLGRLATPEGVEILEDIITHKQADCDYQYHTHALIAMLKIGTCHPELRHRIAEILRKVYSSPAWSVSIPLRGTDKKINENAIFSNYIASVIKTWL